MFVTFARDPDAVIEAEAVDGTETTRTIRGTAVPWNKVGTVSGGQRVSFLPGSLPTEARPIVTLGHDGVAIGKVAVNTATDVGMATEVKVSRTRDGDEALILAADAVLGMFSVGANPTEFTYDDDGVMVVARADWHHLALLPWGAFSDAVVTDVAASAPEQGETMTVTESPSAEITAAPPTQPPTVVPITAAAPAAPPLTLHRIANLVAGANRGEISTEAAKATIAAALANITTTNVGSVVQPVYRSEITGLIDHGTPLFEVLGSGTLPASGMSIEWPQWTTFPTTGIQATEKTQIVSTAAAMTMKTSPVITIAGGNDISLQAVERSSPSFLEAYLRAAAVDWSRKAEAYVLSILTPLADVVPPGADFVENVGLLLGSLDPAATPAGPLFVAMSFDVAVGVVGLKQGEGPAFWNGSISFGSMTPTVDASGLTIVVDTNLPAKTMLAGSKEAATVYKSAGAPADIRVVDVSLLGLDVGVYGYLAVAVPYPGALSVMTLV